MAIPLAHLLISTLELAARISPNSMLPTNHHSASTPPHLCPPPSGHQEEAGPKAFLSLELRGSQAYKFQTETAVVLDFQNQNRYIYMFSFFGESSDFASSQKFLTSSAGSDLEKHFWCQVNPIWPLKTSHSIQLFSKLKKKSSLKLWEISGRPPISWWLLVGV